MKKGLELLKDKVSDMSFELAKSFAKGKESETEEVFNDGKDEAITEVMNLIDEIQESETPTIPDYVAREIEFMKSFTEEFGILPKALGTSDLGEDEEWFEKAQSWKDLNYEKYCTAYANGYNTEEKKYVVRLKGFTHSGSDVYLVKEDEVRVDWSSRDYIERHLNLYSFTEKEINRIDPSYMAFAEPVDEVFG